MNKKYKYEFHKVILFYNYNELNLIQSEKELLFNP